MKLNELKKRAKRKQAQLKRKMRDPRYKNVVGRLVGEGLLIAPKVRANRLHPTVEDALWAGEVEPRILELLPALVLRRPKVFLQARALPEDLALVVKELRRGRAHTAFRGVPAEKYAGWEEFVRVRGPKKAAVTKLFRFQEDDLRRLKELAKKWNVSESEAMREALERCAD